MKKNEKMLSFFVFLLKMITTTNYNSQKLSLGSLQNKKSRKGIEYQNIPILYDGRKAIVHLCGRFQLIPDFTLDYSSSNSLAVEVDDDNRKLFEAFEEKLQSLTAVELELIKYGRVYLKIYLNEGKMVPKFWKVFEKNGKEYKKAILNKDSLDWKNIEGEIVFSIANIFVEKYTKSEDMTEPKSIICVAKEILVREIMDERSYFNIPVGEDSDDEGED